MIKDLNKYLQGQEKGPWPQNKVSALDRGLGEIGRILEKRVSGVRIYLSLICVTVNYLDDNCIIVLGLYGSLFFGLLKYYFPNLFIFIQL